MPVYTSARDSPVSQRAGLYRQHSTSSPGGVSSSGAYFDTGVEGKVGFAGGRVSQIKSKGKIIYSRGGGRVISPVKQKAQPSILIDTKKVSEFNRLMRERGVSAKEYLGALKGDPNAIMKASGMQQAEASFQGVREAEKTSFERAVEKQQSRDQAMYKSRERFKLYTEHYIKGDSWLAKAGRHAIMIPYDFSVGFGSQIASGGEKTYLMNRGLIEKDVGLKSVAKESFRSAKATPKVVFESFDPRKPEGAVNLAILLGATYIGGKAIKHSRAKAGIVSKVKPKSHKMPSKLKVKFRSSKIKVSKNIKTHLQKLGLRKPKWKEPTPARKISAGKLLKKQTRIQNKALQKIHLTRLKKNAGVGRYAKLHKKSITPSHKLYKTSLQQARKKVYVPKKARKLFIKQKKFEQNIGRFGKIGGKKSYLHKQTVDFRLYKASLRQARTPKKPLFSKIFNKKGQQRLVLLQKHKSQVKVSTPKLKTSSLTSTSYAPISLTSSAVFRSASLSIPPTSVIVAGVVKPRQVSLPKLRLGSLPMLKTGGIPGTISKPQLIQRPEVAIDSLTLPKSRQDSITQSLLLSGLTTTALTTGMTTKDLWRTGGGKFKFEWAGGGGGSAGGRTKPWFYGLKKHKIAWRKLF